EGESTLMKKLAIFLAAALLVASTGCGSDSKPTPIGFFARTQEDFTPHLFKFDEESKTATAVNIAIPEDAEYVSANSDLTAVTYCRAGEETAEIFVMGLDNQEHQLTDGADACLSTFSPDGSLIAYTSIPGEGQPQTWIMNADGTNQHVFSSTGVQFSPKF